MLSINQVSVHFAGRYLFEKVTFAVKDRDKIGLVGRNGNGKSTLLKIIANLQTPEEGSVSKANNYTVGYLPQEIDTTSEKTVFEEASSAQTELQELEKRIHEITEELNTRTDYESDEYSNLIHEMTEAHERFDILGGGASEGEVEQVLTGLGFLRDEFTKLVKEFSGGWQMRVELAKLLLSKPNCILLDEPTNHLDIESIRWLEEFLKNYDGSIMIVSHDKRFLDNLTNRTIEITRGKVYDHPYPFTEFMELRNQQRELQIAAKKNQDRLIAQQERFIERFKAKATFASRAASKQKALDKIDIIEVEEEDTSSMNFRFPESPRSGRVLAETHDLRKSYNGSKYVLKGLDFAIERGERIAFVGKNGEGKSTFAKILAMQEPYEGQMQSGHNVQLGYYSQHQAHLLEDDATVFDVIDRAAEGAIRTKIRTLLGAFLFSGDSVYKKVRVLSGGEKSRLALCKLLLQPINFLIMDEPTNHLDMIAKEVLKNALLNYEGAMIIVSHDRDFLDGLTNKTLYFKDGKAKEYLGGINEFITKYDIEMLDDLNKKQAQKQQAPIEIKKADESRELNKNQQKEKAQLEKLIKQNELEIAELELQIANYEKQFADANFYKDPKSANIRKEYDAIKVQLDAKVEEWTKNQELLDVILLS